MWLLFCFYFVYSLNSQMPTFYVQRLENSCSEKKSTHSSIWEIGRTYFVVLTLGYLYSVNMYVRWVIKYSSNTTGAAYEAWKRSSTLFADIFLISTFPIFSSPLRPSAAWSKPKLYYCNDDQCFIVQNCASQVAITHRLGIEPYP